MEAFPVSASGDDVILTGIARSGTTLACTLLNRLPDTVALHEPMSPRILMGRSVPEGVNDAVSGFFTAQRRSLSVRREAASRTIEGRIPDDPYAADPGPNGLRSSQVRDRVVRFDKPLSPAFRLIVKHPSCFTALLGSLKQRFPCHAVVRNPLAILLSWQTTEANWNDGRQPAAEAFDEDLRCRLDAEPDRIGRQLVMLSWSFGQYARHLPAERVIRYEDLVATGGRALVRVAPAADGLSESLHSRNANPVYAGVAIASLVDRLLASSGPQWDFYPREVVGDLAGELLARQSRGGHSQADG